MGRKGDFGANLARLALAALALCSVIGLAGRPASAAITIAGWTFENDIGKINSVATGVNSALLPPSSGAGTAEGHHANSSTQWVAATGNGSSTAFEAAFWGVGDYWEVDFNSTGMTNLSLVFDQMGNGNGPRDFNIQTSTDGTNWTILPSSSYSLPFASWKTEGAFSLPDNIVGVRIVDASSTSVQGIGVTTTGRDFIDNVVVSGVAAVPEPTSIVLWGLGGAAAFLFYRRRKTA